VNELVSPAEANSLIDSGRRLHIAGDEALLRQLHRGCWIGGTIPYFLTREGGVVERHKVFVTALPDFVTNIAIHLVDIGHIPAITSEAPRNGFSIVIVPGLSDIHTTYALTARNIPGIHETPIVGWIAGVHLDDIGKVAPKVFDGSSGEVSDNRIVVMHASLPPAKVARLGIINLFVPGKGDEIEFDAPGFSAGTCTINGKPDDFYDYAVRSGIDLKLPLVTEQSGHRINVSFQALDAASRTVKFYAPVVHRRVYRQAAPLPDYRAALVGATKDFKASPTFSCNCILNYLYGRLEGEQFIPVAGPATFGELAHILVNQTLVYLMVEDRKDGG